MELNDDFESYKVVFSVNNPREVGTSEMLLEANHDEINNQMLYKSNKDVNWMQDKYGLSKRPWMCTVKLSNLEGSNVGEFKQDADTMLRYRYGKRGAEYPQTWWEREPKRSV